MKKIFLAMIVATAFSACNDTSDHVSIKTDSMPAVSTDSAAKLNSGNLGTGMGTDSMGLMNKGSHDSLTNRADSIPGH